MTENKGDLISREALKEKLNKKALDLANGGMIFIESINHIIDNAPTVEERPQGEWNYIQAGMCVCPFCGANPHRVYKNFCSNCGAKMVKGGAE